MNLPNQPGAAHQESWEMLPWLVNGRLGERDRQRVEAHLQQCGACRDEFEAQRQICEVMAAESAVEQMPMAGLNRLRQRIASTDASGAPGGATPTKQDISGRAGRWRPWPGSVAASIVGASVALGIVGAVVWDRAQQRGARASYYTVTSATPQRPDAAIRVVFAPTVTLSELQGMLDEAELRIVSGPTEAGVYSLAMTGSRSLDWSLQRLRGHDTVRFAEAIGPAKVSTRPQ